MITPLYHLVRVGARRNHPGHLRKVQGGRADTNADLSRAGLRVGRFPHLQRLGPGRPGDPHRSHRHILRSRGPTRAHPSARCRSHLPSQIQRG